MGSGASAQTEKKARELLAASEEKLAQRHGQLSTRQDELEERLKSHGKELHDHLDKLLKKETSRLEAAMERQAKRYEESLEGYVKAQGRELKEVQSAAGKDIGGAVTRLDAVEPRMAAFEKELDRLSAAAAKMPGEVRREFKSELESSEAIFAESLEQISSNLAETKRRGEELSQGLDAAVQRCAELEAEMAALRALVQDSRSEAERLQGAMKSEQDAALQQLVTAQGKAREGAEQDMRSAVADFEAKNRAQLEDVGRALRANADAMELARAVAESVHTRSFAWRLKGFRGRLARLLSAGEAAAFRSPGFHLCGLPELQLELQIGGDDDNEEAPLPSVPVPVPGSVTLRLWAAPGCRLAFRATLGEAGAAVARRFEQEFGREVSAALPDEQGRLCFAAQNFAQLDQVWDRSSDSVLFLFELLEFRCAPVPALADAETTLQPDDARRSPLRKPSFLERPPGALGADEGEDEVSCVRSGTSEILLEERVRGEIQALRNRSVRRVEWRLEGVQRMLELCKTGECVESPAFCAAGLERLVFHLYPRGYDLNASTAGSMAPCALFVSGPAKTTLKGLLWVGSLSRQLEHRFRYKGDTGGRARFGPMDSQVDCGDAVVIALDVQEVEVDLPEVGGSLVLRDTEQPRVRSPQLEREVSSPGPRPSSKGKAAPLVRSKGTLRVKREDPCKTEELVRCVSLPTLNARQLHLSAFKGKRGVLGA